MHDSKLFDQWVNSYEKDIYDLKDEYPFAGYFTILEKLKTIIAQYDVCQVLDLGVGTGLMRSLLQKEIAFSYTGFDFSKKMVAFAQKRLVSDRLFEWDLKQPNLPDCLLSERFDIILSAFTLHHFLDTEKLSIIQRYMKLLKKGGQFIIADISFDDQAHFERIKKEAGKRWDLEEEKGYFNSPRFLEIVESTDLTVRYEKTSFCTGMYFLSKALR